MLDCRVDFWFRNRLVIVLWFGQELLFGKADAKEKAAATASTNSNEKYIEVTNDIEFMIDASISSIANYQCLWCSKNGSDRVRGMMDLQTQVR